ncbi:RNA polymerase sigma-70 factor [Sphingobacterium phlebotomi]|uniref:RNA polymerase sigma-70 factor n=1 Tax=Sphingobacterium phlebotomi TaxID=2605433 RepID=A0A5D4H3V4_9SPHI|nr:RNA polymerase sigma-70 factor [Sphingobacterium phlebotomi]TYR34125.1 RNA polymerase sigma-70 factor [Sphingobacterium phlebotomi]
MYSSLEDKVLLSFVQKGRTEAFRELYERYWENLYAHASAMASCEDTAKDIVQELFLELWDKKENLDIQISLKAYLYRIVRNKVLNTYAQHKIHEKYMISLAQYGEVGENRTDYLLRENLVQERIDEEISALPLKMRQIFEMSRNGNKTHKEIAEELNISDKTVKKQVNNALKILKSRLAYVFYYLLLTTLMFLF